MAVKVTSYHGRCPCPEDGETAELHIDHPAGVLTVVHGCGCVGVIGRMPLLRCWGRMELSAGKASSTWTAVAVH